MANKRQQNVDIAKAILIIFVILGHGGMWAQYIYWFHMPAFFIISGMFLPNITNATPIKPVLRKTAMLLIPYVTYLVLFYLLAVSTHLDETVMQLSFLVKLAIGGRLLNGLFTVFWFISCLIVAQTIYIFIEKYCRHYYKYAIYVAMYLLAHVEAAIFSADSVLFYVPLCADVALLALPLMVIGKELKNRLLSINPLTIKTGILTIFCIAVCALLIKLSLLGIIQYELDMKSVVYQHLLLDLVIPFAFFISIFLVSSYLQYVPVLSSFLARIGQLSLTIMYLHMAVMYLLKLLNIYTLFYTVILSIIISWAVTWLCTKNKSLSLLFMGKLPSKAIIN